MTQIVVRCITQIVVQRMTQVGVVCVIPAWNLLALRGFYLEWQRDARGHDANRRPTHDTNRCLTHDTGRRPMLDAGRCSTYDTGRCHQTTK